MKSNILGITEISFNGETFKVQFNMAALEAIATHFDMTPIEALDLVQDKGAAALNPIISAGLQKHHPDFDFKTADLTMPVNEVHQKIFDAIGSAYTGNLPVEDKANDQEQETPKKGKTKRPAGRSKKV